MGKSGKTKGILSGQIELSGVHFIWLFAPFKLNNKFFWVKRNSKIEFEFDFAQSLLILFECARGKSGYVLNVLIIYINYLFLIIICSIILCFPYRSVFLLILYLQYRKLKQAHYKIIAFSLERDKISDRPNQYFKSRFFFVFF